MARAAVFWAICLSFVRSPARAEAQVIRGRLVDLASHAPIASGRFVLFDTSGRMIASIQSSGSGAFAIRAPAAGRYLFRGAAIGYDLAPLADVTVGASGATVGEVPLSRAATKLPDLVARSRPALTWTSHFYRLWDSATGRCIAVVAYQLDFRNLIVSGVGPAATASVLLSLHQGNARHIRDADTTVKLQLSVPPESGAESKYAGFFTAPSATEVTNWTLIVTQPERRGGSDWEEERAPLADEPFSISDLVVGTARQGLAWENAGQRIFLTALEPIDVSDSMHLYYQVRSADARPIVHTEIRVYHADTEARSADRVAQFAFDTALASGINVVARTLDMSRLNPGRYRIEVEVVDSVTRTVAHQSVNLYFE